MLVATSFSWWSHSFCHHQNLPCLYWCLFNIPHSQVLSVISSNDLLSPVTHPLAKKTPSHNCNNRKNLFANFLPWNSFSEDSFLCSLAIYHWTFVLEVLWFSIFHYSPWLYWFLTSILISCPFISGLSHVPRHIRYLLMTNKDWFTVSLFCHSQPDNPTFGILSCLLPLFRSTHLPSVSNTIMYNTLLILMTFWFQLQVCSLWSFSCLPTFKILRFPL